MQGRGRGQLPPFHKAATFLLRASVTTPATPPTIASVTYDDPTGSWESWEPGAAWGSAASGGRSTALPGNPMAKEPPKSEPTLRWDEDSDTNLRHPKQLPRTLITMSELDWEDSEECATELWNHPQRPRMGRDMQPRGDAAGPRMPPRGMRPQQPDPGRRGAPAQEGNRAARSNGGGAPRNGSALRPGTPRPAPSQLPPRAAEPTARMRTAAPTSHAHTTPNINGAQRAPQRLPAAPPPRAEEPLPERRERTITQPGAAPHQLPHPVETASLEPQLPAARVAPPHPPRSLMQTQVSGFGSAPRADLPPSPRPAEPRPMASPVAAAVPQAQLQPSTPAIESLRERLVTPRLLPPPRTQSSAHIPTILGTPAASGTSLRPEAPPALGAPRLQPPAAAPAQTDARSEVIEQLQEQLLESMARARVQEARADEAEKSVVEAEEQLEAIVRAQMTETEQLREQLRNTTGQLRLTETRVQEAERRSLVMQRPSNMLHLAEPELAVRPHKQSRANLILSGLLASSLSFGGAAYFMFYAPLQKQLTALEQQRLQDAQVQANALTNQKAQSAAERQGLEAQNSELRSQLEAARAEALAMNAADEGKRGRSRRSSSADSDSAEETPAGTRSARAIERRMRRSRAAAQDGDEAEAPAPARASRSSRDNGDDPLGGI